MFIGAHSITNRSYLDQIVTIFQDPMYFYGSSPSKMFLGKGVLKICSKFTEEYPCRSLISIKLQSNLQ